MTFQERRETAARRGRAQRARNADAIHLMNLRALGEIGPDVTVKPTVANRVAALADRLTTAEGRIKELEGILARQIAEGRMDFARGVERERLGRTA